MGSEFESKRERLNRRGFFRGALERAVHPLAEFLAERFPRSEPRVRLRPPGAIDESGFIKTCLRCGKCIETCPVQAIFPLDSSYGDAAGSPAIDPERAACVDCEGVQCTHVCPSGALTPLFEGRLIRMGLAVVNNATCVRTAGEDCTICVDRCPFGSEAILFVDGGPPWVRSDGCVGCGVCQLYCPTQPRAIVIRPL